ncbi:39S ribosomal protein L1, mitochondrial [Contarinia nasturtii]|uniref:39S ribosomal protein L1, mitochondrial n=1 Tax=Contarinia nasturtii TaxID=265458 RepID=UPI0012D44D77|nr:39S ribosomal protein L1, mitochondrial [Contarinia nasturtii]
MLGLRSMFSRLMIRPQSFYQPAQCIHTSEVDLRARKGTRERREKIAKKNRAAKLAKITKVGYIPQRKWSKSKVDKHLVNLNMHKLAPIDDAFPGRYYRWPEFKMEDAINFHKETLDPTMYDAMDSPLNITIEMNMIGEKATRLVSNFNKLVLLKHPFEHGQERKILAFAKEEVNRSKAIEAGATTVGGSDMVKLALKGNVRFADYHFILAHPDIMPEMLALRGLMKKRFPSAKNETLGLDMYEMVTRFMSGIFINGLRDEHQQDYGVVNTKAGILTMPTEQIVQNVRDIMSSVNAQRPKRAGKFITRLYFTTPESKEIFKISPADFPFEDYERPGALIKLDQAKPKKKQAKPCHEAGRTYELFRTSV